MLQTWPVQSFCTDMAIYDSEISCRAKILQKPFPLTPRIFPIWLVWEFVWTGLQFRALSLLTPSTALHYYHCYFALSPAGQIDHFLIAN